MTDRLRVFAFHHAPEVVASIPALPWLTKGLMQDCGGDPRLAENRLILSPAVESPGAEYAGILNGRSEEKYPGFRWKGLGTRLSGVLKPNVVTGPWPTDGGPVPCTDWLDFSETRHPGVAALVREACAAAGVPLHPRRPSLWANDFVCHHAVWADWLATYRRASRFALGRWGFDPPFDSPDQERSIAFVLERVTTAYFAARQDLKIVPLPGAPAPPKRFSLRGAKASARTSRPPESLPPGGYVKHFLCYVCPVAGNGTWQWNVERVKRWLPLFDGIRAVAVAEAAPGATTRRWDRKPFTLDPPGAVAEALAGCGCEVFPVPHAPDLGEVVAFPHLWGRASRHAGHADVVFYCHAKGVTYTPTPQHILDWTDVLYRGCLGHWPLVEDAFRRRYSTIGVMRQVGDEESWIFPGAFYWFRTRDAFRRPDWATKLPHWYSGVERWPGLVFHWNEGKCLFKTYPFGMQAYDPGWMAATAEEFRRWEEANRQYRTLLGG